MAKKLRAKRLLGILSNISSEDNSGDINYAKELARTESVLNNMGIDLSEEDPTKMPGIMMPYRSEDFKFTEGSLESEDPSMSVFPGSDKVVSDLSSYENPRDMLDYLTRLEGKTAYNIGDLVKSINESGKIPYRAIGGTSVTGGDINKRTPSIALTRNIDRYEIGRDAFNNDIRWVYFDDGSRRMMTEKEWGENIDKIRAFNRLPQGDPLRKRFYEVISSDRVQPPQIP